MSNLENVYQGDYIALPDDAAGGKPKGIRELVKYKELLWHFVTTQLKTEHRDKVLGNIWAILDPLALMLVYMFVVGVIFKAKEPNFPVFLFTGIVAWRFFNGSVRGAANCLTKYSGLIRLAYFPKTLIPIAHVITKLFDLAFGIAALSFLFIIYKVDVTIYFAWLPVLIALLLMFNLGCAFYIAYFGVYFKDIANVLKFTIRLLWFFSPVLYSVDRVPKQFVSLYMINPLATILVSFRNVTLYAKNPPFAYLTYFAILSVFLLVTGYYIFKKKEGDYAKYI